MKKGSGCKRHFDYYIKASLVTMRLMRDKFDLTSALDAKSIQANNVTNLIDLHATIKMRNLLIVSFGLSPSD